MVDVYTDDEAVQLAAALPGAVAQLVRDQALTREQIIELAARMGVEVDVPAPSMVDEYVGKYPPGDTLALSDTSPGAFGLGDGQADELTIDQAGYILALSGRTPYVSTDAAALAAARLHEAGLSGLVPLEQPVSKYRGESEGYEDSLSLSAVEAETEVGKYLALAGRHPSGKFARVGHSSNPLVKDMDDDENGSDDGQPAAGGKSHADEIVRLSAASAKLAGDNGNRPGSKLSPAAREAAERRARPGHDSNTSASSIPDLAGYGNQDDS